MSNLILIWESWNSSLKVAYRFTDSQATEFVEYPHTALQAVNNKLMFVFKSNQLFKVKPLG
jgi:hypothetical protein